MKNQAWFGRSQRAFLFGMLTWSVAGLAQNIANRAETTPVDSLGAAVRALSEQVRTLQSSVVEMRLDAERARAETRELRREIEQLRAEQGPQKLESMQTKAHARGPLVALTDADLVLPGATGEQQDEQIRDEQDQKAARRAASLEEEYELLSGKVDDQYQTKVESASKYRMRISGIVLMNLFSNQGSVDNTDLPALAFPRHPGDTGGSFGATLRQSEIGFEVFGPHVSGAKTKADLQVDFTGGFPSLPNGINSGLMRLRMATMRMDWTNTSVVAGQDALFMSPGSPTSFATLAMPALSYAGNLWSWVPQIRVEHRVTLGEESSLLFQGGILEPNSGEVPGAASYRLAGPGESSRQPAYGTRVAWTHNLFGQPLRFGVGGFYGRQDYGYNRNVDAWAGMADMEVPLGPQFSLSGKFYRGRALGGFYGGLGQSVLFSSSNPNNPYTEVIGLDTIGGWGQLKYRPARKLEFNLAFGMDNPYAKDLRYFGYPQTYFGTPWSRNRAGFANVIYRPRSDVLFSAEYRRLETDSVASGLSGAGHLNLMMGVLF